MLKRAPRRPVRLALVAVIVVAAIAVGGYMLGRHSAGGSGLDPAAAACLSTANSPTGSPAYVDNDESLAQCEQNYALSGPPLVP